MIKLKGWLIACCVVALLAGGCLAESAGDVGDADAVSAQETAREPLLPIDFSFGTKPVAANFKTDGKTYWDYEDPSISVHIIADRYKKGFMGCAYWVATVKLQDASQMRTLSDKGFDKSARVKGLSLASRAHPVMAINGDFYCYRGDQFVLRQGKLYVDLLIGERDLLAIDEDGDFHVYHNPRKEDLESRMVDEDTKEYIVNGKKIINAMHFGPILVENGQLNTQYEKRSDMAADQPRQRMAIAQVGPLEYKCICCAGPSRGSEGLTLDEFAKVVYNQNVQVAYNLDGGDSTMMIFNGKRINDPADNTNRVIGDIIYFASAYQGE